MQLCQSFNTRDASKHNCTYAKKNLKYPLEILHHWHESMLLCFDGTTDCSSKCYWPLNREVQPIMSVVAWTRMTLLVKRLYTRVSTLISRFVDAIVYKDLLYSQALQLCESPRILQSWKIEAYFWFVVN